VSKAVAIALLALGCSDPGDQWMTQQSPIQQVVDAGAPALVFTGSHSPRQLPDCIHLEHSFTDWFEGFGWAVVQGEVDRWLVATGNEAGDIPVVFDERCPIRINRGPVTQPDRGVRAGVTYPDGTITIYDAIQIWECPASHFGLAPIVAHELGHAFGCRHNDDSRLMRPSGPRCNTGEIDKTAIGCASALRRDNQ